MNKPIQAQSDKTIKNAIASAQAHREAFATQAIISGQMLIEKRAEIENAIPVKFGGGDGEAEASPVFHEWAATICEKESRRTLFYWMSAAGRVVKHLLNKSPGEPCPITLLSEGGFVLVSQVMAGTEEFIKSLPAPAQAFRDQFDGFMQDKTLRDANVAVLEGLSPESRITLAANGKRKGGKGAADRKDWPLFMGWDLQTFSKHGKHWDAMTPVQKNEVGSLLRSWVIGDEAKLPGREEANFRFTIMPSELRQILKEAIREADRLPVPAN